MDPFEFGAWSKLCDSGALEEAFQVLDKRDKSGQLVSSRMLQYLLKNCLARRNGTVGRQVHALCVRTGCEADTHLGARLIRFYAAQRSLTEATSVFSKLAAPDAYAWTAMITAYRDNGQPGEAIRLYHQMRQSEVEPTDRTFVAVLKACVSALDLSSGKLIHSHVMTSGLLETNVYIGSILIDMYSKWGNLKDARAVFESLSCRDVVAWTAMIAGYAQHGFWEEAISLYDGMVQKGITPDSYTYSNILKSCAGAGERAGQRGRQIHEQVLERGLDTDPHVASSLVDMYVKFGKLEDARRVFDRLPVKDVVTWNVLLAGFLAQGLGQEVLNMFWSMKQQQQQQGLVPDAFVYVSVLKACASTGAVQEGRRLHAEILQRGLESDAFVSTSLLKMYVKCGSVKDAQRVFDRLQVRGTVDWSALIYGYAQHGLAQKALELYKSMKLEGLKPEYATYACVLKACGSSGAIEQGKQIHREIVDEGGGLDSNVVVGSALVDMYVKCEQVREAREVFDRLPSKDVVTWSAMIAGYASAQQGHEGVALYRLMQQDGGVAPDSVTFVNVLKACGYAGALQEGKQIHAEVAERGLVRDVFVASALMSMYAKCGILDCARTVFDALAPCKDVVPWSIMIAGYADAGLGEEAVQLYRRMRVDKGLSLPAGNEVIYVSILKACGSARDVAVLKEVHGEILDRGLESGSMTVANTLIDAYAKCGRMEDARDVFDRVPVGSKDVVTWSTLIAGYANHGLGQEAIDLYRRMQEQENGSVVPDKLTLVSVLKACSCVGAVQEGKQVHARIAERGLEQDLYVGNTLVYMYAHCGELEQARAVADKLVGGRDVVTWNALISGYGQHNDCGAAVRCLDEMREQGVVPDAATFTALLVACSLAGEVDTGRHLFGAMEATTGVAPRIEHYTCMADLLGRSGQVEEAEAVLLAMPHAADSVAWMCLLSACKTYGKAQLGRACFDRLVALNPQHAAAYVVMSSLYAGAGRWADVAEVEALRSRAGAEKKLAKAVIEVGERVHEFTVGDDRRDTSAVLRSLNAQVKREQGRGGVRELTDQEREDALCGHAEKLAVAFGLLNTPQGAPLFVVKNLRMCRHCHDGTKIISGVEGREIVVRDAHRVHHFKAGACSCGDDL